MDWKFDWINRHDSERQPKQFDRARRNGETHPDMLVLHVTGGPRIESALQKFLGTATNGGIHYIVDLDGHAVKLADEQFATQHAGFKDRREDAKLNAKGWTRQTYSSKWGMKDKGRSSSVFLQSIGIEHQIAGGEIFPKAMTHGSLHLVEQICNHFGIDPWNVFGHADGITLKGKNRLPRGGSQVVVEEFTKSCPGTEFPWDKFQDFVNQGGVRQPLSLGPAHGVKAEAKKTIYGGIFEHLNFINDTAPNTTVKTLRSQAIEELQKDLRRMGFWCPGWKSSPAKRVRDAETFGDLDFGKFDNATHGAVRLFQRRCMMPRKDTVAKQGKVDLLTAQRIKQTVATAALPPLELPKSTPP